MLPLLVSAVQKTGFALFTCFALVAIGWFTPLIVVCMAILVPLVVVLALTDHGVRALFRLPNEHPVRSDQIRAGLSAPIATAAVLAPLRAVHVFIDETFFPAVFWGRTDFIDPIIAAAGLSLAILFGIPALNDLMREAKQLRNLPRSKARSAAMGLVELQGTVAPFAQTEALTVTQGMLAIATPPDNAVLFHAKRFVRSGKKSSMGNWTLDVKRPFYLTDDTGRILIDPTAASFYELSFLRFWESSTAYWQSGPKIYLRRRKHKKGRINFEEQAVLLEGDRVTVVGTCELRQDGPEKDPERRVIRAGPSRERKGFLTRWFPYLLEHRLAVYDNPFFLTDGSESVSRFWLRSQLMNAVIFAAIWVVPSAWLLLSHTRLFLRSLT